MKLACHNNQIQVWKNCSTKYFYVFKYFNWVWSLMNREPKINLGLSIGFSWNQPTTLQAIILLKPSEHDLMSILVLWIILFSENVTREFNTNTTLKQKISSWIIIELFRKTFSTIFLFLKVGFPASLRTTCWYHE